MSYGADRHTDSRIASLMMGYKPDPRVPGAFQPIDASGSPMSIAPLRFSSDIRAAMQVVDQLIAGGYEVAMFTTSGEARVKGRWTCVIASGDVGAKSHADTPHLPSAEQPLRSWMPSRRANHEMPTRKPRPVTYSRLSGSMLTGSSDKNVALA